MNKSTNKSEEERKYKNYRPRARSRETTDTPPLPVINVVMKTLANGSIPKENAPELVRENGSRSHDALTALKMKA